MNRQYDPYYNSKHWKHLRAARLRLDLFKCVVPGCNQPAYAVDHMKARRAGGADTIENLRSLCKQHDHSIKETRTGARGNAGKLVVKGFFADGTPRDPSHPWYVAKSPPRELSAEVSALRLPRDLKPSRIPLTIVVGAAGSGKSTYVRERVRDGDLVIDLDAIMSRLSGLPEHNTHSLWLPAALAERNTQLRGLADDHAHTRAWFIIGAPDPIERAAWQAMLKAELVVMPTPLDVCIQRIKADTMRSGHEQRMIEAARAWFRLNEGLGAVQSSDMRGRNSGSKLLHTLT